MKLILAAATFLLTTNFVLSQQPKTVTLTGHVSGDTKGNDYIFFYGKSTPIDSVKINKGRFVIKIPVQTTYTQLLYTQYEKVIRGMYRPFPILIDGSGDVVVDMDIEKGFYEAKMSGSSTSVGYNQFLKKQSAAYQLISTDIKQLYGKPYLPAGDPMQAKFEVSRDSLSSLHIGGAIRSFVAEHTNDYSGLYVLNSSGRSVMSADMLESTLSTLSSTMRKSAEGELLANFIRGVRNTSIGAKVNNFDLNNADGALVSFDQFKGKYVWIDFWATWCGPCKMAFPHMKEVYAAYKDKGFEIIGISTDEKMAVWTKALPVLNNPWPQLWDSKNIKEQFAITAYPTSFLIDPQGKIILKEIGYDPNGSSPLDKKLEEIFGYKPISAPVPTSDTTRRKPTQGVPVMRALKING